jgi:nucleotide-binding universal stress UspA family protein
MSTCTGIAIRNILLPTDFSDESLQAIGRLEGLQRHYNANVYFVHVLDVFPFSLSSAPSAVAKMESIRQTGSARLQEFVQKHGLNKEKFEWVLLSGEVSSAVDQFAQEHEIDLIVLGSRGDVGIKRLFQGSAAEEIFRTARCPVMVVGPGSSPAESSGVFNHLFFPTDLSPFSRAALPYVEFLLNENSAAKVSLAHFIEQGPRTPYERYKIRRESERELIAMISPAARHQIDQVAVEFGSPAEGIVGMSHGLGADLLVLGVRQGGSFVRAATHGLFSIAHHITTQAPCPVLTIRSQ